MFSYSAKTVESLPHAGHWMLRGNQKQTSSLLLGSICSVKEDGQSILKEESIVLRELKQRNEP